MSYLLDTNIITAILKNNQQATTQLRSAGQSGARVCISCITYYETKRGLLYSDATRQLSKFVNLCTTVEILLIDNLEIIETASEFTLSCADEEDRFRMPIF